MYLGGLDPILCGYGPAKVEWTVEKAYPWAKEKDLVRAEVAVLWGCSPAPKIDARRRAEKILEERTCPRSPPPTPRSPRDQGHLRVTTRLNNRQTRTGKCHGPSLSAKAPKRSQSHPARHPRDERALWDFRTDFRVRRPA